MQLCSLSSCTCSKINIVHLFRIFLMSWNIFCEFTTWIITLFLHFVDMHNKYLPQKYLNGCTVVNKNHSLKPLSNQTVLPIAWRAWKKGCGCTPSVIHVAFSGTTLSLPPAKIDLSPWPSYNWLSKPMLLSFLVSCPFISWKKEDASSVTTMPYPSVVTNLFSIPSITRFYCRFIVTIEIMYWSITKFT